MLQKNVPIFEGKLTPYKDWNSFCCWGYITV